MSAYADLARGELVLELGAMHRSFNDDDVAALRAVLSAADGVRDLTRLLQAYSRLPSDTRVDVLARLEAVAGTGGLRMVREG